MSRHVKNLELFHENRGLQIAHQRQLRVEDAKTRPQDLNFWKVFSKMPRANSMKQNEEKIVEGFNNNTDD